jgi:hypothetical protein
MNPIDELKQSLPEDLRGCMMTFAEALAQEKQLANSPIRILIEMTREQFAALLRTMQPARPLRLTRQQVADILNRLAKGETKTSLAAEFGVTRQAIQNLARKMERLRAEANTPQTNSSEPGGQQRPDK